MVYLSGSELSSGFTDGTSVVAIYTYGCQVWPVEEPWNGSGIGPEVHPGDYYISWTPSDLSGVFSIAGRNYYLESYSGYFTDFDGVITSKAFESTKLETLETNAIRVNYRAFNSCGWTVIDESHFEANVLSVSMSYCSFIGTEAFFHVFISSLYLPKCTWISEKAFYNCRNLESLSLPECTFIGQSAFWCARELHNINLPVCSMIASGAFTSISDNNTVKLGYPGLVAGAGAFSPYITRLIVPDWLRYSYSYEWSGVLEPGLTPMQRITGFHYLSIPQWSYYSEANGGMLGSGMMESSYSSTLSYFETDATGFASSVCSGFTELERVRALHCSDIRNAAFRNCTKLKEFYIGDDRDSGIIRALKEGQMYARAFEGCTALESIVLPNWGYIYSSAFKNCTSLSMVMIGGSRVCSLSDSVFYGCTNLQGIYVPKSLYSSYKTDSGWSPYSDIIYSY